MENEAAVNLSETKVKEIENGQVFLQQPRQNAYDDSVNNLIGPISKYDGVKVNGDGDVSDSSKYFTAREEEDSGHSHFEIDQEIASFKGAPRST